MSEQINNESVIVVDHGPTPPTLRELALDAQQQDIDGMTFSNYYPPVKLMNLRRQQPPKKLNKNHPLNRRTYS